MLDHAREPQLGSQRCQAQGQGMGPRRQGPLAQHCVRSARKQTGARCAEGRGERGLQG